MSFLTLNGLAIDVGLGDLDRDYADAQYWQRSEAMTYEGCTYRELREFSFPIPAQFSDYESQAQRGWIKGRGHSWDFGRIDGATTRFNRYSDDGGPAFTEANTFAATTPFGTGTGRLSLGVNSAQSTTVTVTFGSEGRYSVALWRWDNGVGSGDTLPKAVVYDGVTTRYYSGTTVTTAFSWMTLTAASGYLSVNLQGEDHAASNATAVYDHVRIYPYGLTTSMLAAFQSSSWTPSVPLPYLLLDGDCVEDLQPIVVKGFVTSEVYSQVQYQGAVTNIRMPKVKLIER